MDRVEQMVELQAVVAWILYVTLSTATISRPAGQYRTNHRTSGTTGCQLCQATLFDNGRWAGGIPRKEQRQMLE